MNYIFVIFFLFSFSWNEARTILRIDLPTIKISGSYTKIGILFRICATIAVCPNGPKKGEKITQEFERTKGLQMNYVPRMRFDLWSFFKWNVIIQRRILSWNTAKHGKGGTRRAHTFAGHAIACNELFCYRWRYQSRFRAKPSTTSVVHVTTNRSSQCEEKKLFVKK